jgi:hypothetical protein
MGSAIKWTVIGLITIVGIGAVVNARRANAQVEKLRSGTEIDPE